MATGDIHNHNGTICRAEKIRCPFGDEGHSKDIDSYVEHHVQESGVNGEAVRDMISDGTPPADAVEVAKGGYGALGSVQQEVDALKESPEGVNRFRAYRDQWNDAWAKAYQRHYGQTTEEHLSKESRAALEARSKPGTYDGAWIKPQDDGGMAVPAGEYVFVSSDGWHSSESDKHYESGADKWEIQALEGTPPGTVGGAYLEGKPAFFLTSMSMGENHGYDGEILVPKETFDSLSARGYFNEDSGIEITVGKDTVIYGDLGNPKDAPQGLYDWSPNEGAVSEDAEAVYIFEKRREGTIFNHPFIAAEETPMP